jgi:hypothetical protein
VCRDECQTLTARGKWGRSDFPGGKQGTLTYFTYIPGIQNYITLFVVEINGAEQDRGEKTILQSPFILYSPGQPDGRIADGLGTNSECANAARIDAAPGK